MTKYVIASVVLYIAVMSICIWSDRPTTFKDSECIAIPLVKVAIVPANVEKTHNSYIVTERHQRSVWRCVRD